MTLRSQSLLLPFSSLECARAECRRGEHEVSSRSLKNTADLPSAGGDIRSGALEWRITIRWREDDLQGREGPSRLFLRGPSEYGFLGLPN